MRDIDLIVVHHTASPQDATFDSIRNYHINDRGWSDIGYHYVIGPEGTLFLGRPVWRIGAHAKGKNSKSIGVSVIGNYESDTLTCAIRVQLYQLLNDLKRHFPNAQVVGHRDVAATLCPGKNLYEWLQTI
jgi:N-acetyl-anhydromuramyl-L-alanine amidase AmpD